MSTRIFSIFIFLLCLSCQKAEELLYNSSDNIYFDFDDAGSSDRDSILYTFAYDPGKAHDTIFLPVKISGQRVGKDRTFRLVAVSNGTTAVAGTHYEAFKDSYIMPADSGTYALPVVLYNTDPLLTQQSVTLKFELVETADFGLQITGLNSGKIEFSSKLEKPVWWEMWLGGYYSQVKHELFLISSGTIHMTMDGLDAPKNLYHVGRLNSFLADPFSWVTANAESGYALTQVSPSLYHFFNAQNPAKITVLKKNEQSGRFYFIDENGQEVI